MWEPYLVFIAITTVLFMFILGTSESGDSGLQNFGDDGGQGEKRKKTPLEVAGIKPLQSFE